MEKAKQETVRNAIAVVKRVLDYFLNKWKRMFKAKPFLIMGDRGTGKTALFLFMKNGRPSEKKGDQWCPPNPTAGIDKRKSKKDFDGGRRIVTNRDIGGDQIYRADWKTSIQETRPEGIIYMIDGRHVDLFPQEMDEFFRDCLANCDSKVRLPHTVHVFLNFADQWGDSEACKRQRCRHIEQLYDERAVGNDYFRRIKFYASPTSLEPESDHWPDTEKALEVFASDLARRVVP